jgi:hypothetical protein
MHHIARRFVFALVAFDVHELPEGMFHLKSFADKAFNSATRLAAVGVSALLLWPALIGMWHSMSRRTAAGSLTSPAQRRFDRDHATADIHANRGGHDRTLSGDNRPHRGALSIMTIGHHRDVFEDECHRGGILDLLQRLGFYRVGWQEQHGFIVEPVHIGKT